MIRQRSDVRSVLIVFATVVVHVVMVTGLFRHPALGVLGGLLAYVTLLINHNHHHVATFRPAWANRCFEIAITLAQGLPGSLLVPLHNRNHHHACNGPEDVMRTALVDRLPRWLRLFLYPLCAAMAYLPRKRAFLAAIRRDEPTLWRRIQSERLALLLAVAVMLWWDPIAFLWYPLLAWIAAHYWIINANYLQHADVHDAPARNFTGRCINWLTFNGGYHIEHHQHPGVHWSRLPELHARGGSALPVTVLEKNFPFLVLRLAIGRLARKDTP